MSGLSFLLSPEWWSESGPRHDMGIGAAPPLPELMVLGELAQAAATSALTR